MNNNLTALKNLAREARRTILSISYEAGVGHIGSALSIADIITVLYHHTMRTGNGDAPGDRFILSKGHAASALYATLAQRGGITKRALSSYCRDGGMFGTHPDYHPRMGFAFGTGSLGHGLSVGIGMAMGLPKARVYVLLSDAELNEGSVWEAVMFACQHKLANLTAVIDDNGQQAFGKTRDIINLRPLLPKWKAFGWEGMQTNGHDIEALVQAFSIKHTMPSVIVARTILGFPVSFMKRKIAWHYYPLDKTLYERAIADVETYERLCDTHS